MACPTFPECEAPADPEGRCTIHDPHYAKVRRKTPEEFNRLMEERGSKTRVDISIAGAIVPKDQVLDENEASEEVLKT